MSMKSIFIVMLIVGAFTAVSCTSNNSKKNTTDSTGAMMPDTATSGMGADTTSAATDSLRDSLNR